MLPKVAVIIPNFNHGDRILDAVKSISEQTYPHGRLSIYIVDDCSTDNSLAVLAEHFDLDSIEREVVYSTKEGLIEVTIIPSPENFGRSKTRNLGIRTAWDECDILCFLDADDIYHPEKIQKSVDIYMSSPQNIGVVYSDYDSHNVSSGVTVREFRPPFDLNHLFRNCIINNDSLVSKAALQAVGGYDETMEVAEDHDLWLRICTRFVAIHIPEALVTVNVLPQGATASVAQHVWQKNWQLIGERMQSGYYN